MRNRETDLDFTGEAKKLLYDVVDDSRFPDKDALLIYNSLKHRLKFRSFGDYLRRYIYRKAGLTKPFKEVPLDEYRLIIQTSFSDNQTPASFSAKTSKLSSLSRNWLTQSTVRRNVVFLLGFGLNMSVEDVNMFLTKGIREQEINPKDPFEVICWYCFKNNFNYLKFEELWDIYNNISPKSPEALNFNTERTITVRNSMCSINSEKALVAHLSKLKATDTLSAISVTIKKSFGELYDEARDLVAKIYNSNENEDNDTVRFIQKLSESERFTSLKKQKRIEEFRSKKKVFCREDITESDIEHIICSAIPTDRYGNIIPARSSKLSEQFEGKRFSRQRLRDILLGNVQATRFDLITLNFFVFSQKLDIYPDPKTRYLKFLETMNNILEKCFLGKMYVQNPYECFILMCILSGDPLGTYADVLELSYAVTE